MAIGRIWSSDPRRPRRWSVAGPDAARDRLRNLCAWYSSTAGRHDSTRRSSRKRTTSGAGSRRGRQDEAPVRHRLCLSAAARRPASGRCDHGHEEDGAAHGSCRRSVFHSWHPWPCRRAAALGPRQWHPAESDSALHARPLRLHSHPERELLARLQHWNLGLRGQSPPHGAYRRRVQPIVEFRPPSLSERGMLYSSQPWGRGR